MRKSVVITGVGVVTPVGIGTEAFTHALCTGRSGVGRIKAFDCDGFETQIAAEVEDATFDPTSFVQPPKLSKLMNRATLFGVAATHLARRAARLGVNDVDAGRLGVSLGAGGMGPTDLDILTGQANALLESARDGGFDTFDIPAFAKVYRARTNPLSMIRGLPNLAAAHIAIQHNAQGPNSTLTTACTAGTQAIGDGSRMIQRGDADVVFAGGTDAMVNPVGVLGFTMLGTLSRRNNDPARAARPFDKDRDGFVIGEGAGMLVLEREEFARARGAVILGEIVGYAATCDAYRITDERPDAAGATAAIRRCLEDAGASPEDVDYVNAHGTGTVMNDRTETLAIKQAFGNWAYGVPVSSTKSMIGHLLAGAGAVEAVACVLSMNAGFVPPTLNYDTPDPACDLDYVPREARTAQCQTALSNSFGFGGQNACLLIHRP